MSTAYKVHVVFLEETRNHVRPKGEGYATIVFTPPGDVLVGIGPQEVTEQTNVGDVGRPHHPTNLVHRVEVWRQTAMHGEDLFVDNRRYGQAVEAVCKRLPQLDVISSFAYGTR